MSDLFASANPKKPGLADRLRPTEFDHVFGQDHLTKADSPFRRRVAADQIGAMVLYGPPGASKTTLARIVGAQTNRTFRSLNGTTSKVEDLRAVIQEAKVRPVLLFVDEIHRYTAPRQDDFLALTEDGTIHLIGATTGNPFHDLTPALASRATIFRIHPLDESAQRKLFERAKTSLLDTDGVIISGEETAIRDFIRRAGGDGRRLLTAIENLTVGREGPDQVIIDPESIAQAYDTEAVYYDKGGDQHYDVVSAFIKSMRGSDPDASLFWLARMIHAGEPPEFIARRLLIHASEDVGLADNTCLQTAVAALQAVMHVGRPESDIILAHATLHIARAPKSNSAYRGIALAKDLARERPDITVPPYLRDGHYAGAKKLGHVGYQFPHADPRGWVEQDYLPGIPAGTLYQSDARSSTTFEGRADQFWSQVRSLRPGDA